MNPKPIVWTFRRCPYAIRARMAIDVADIDVEYREIVLRDKPGEMLEASPKATVPVCILGGGRVIDESLDVMRWALSQSDPEAWLATDAEESGAINAWITANDAFKPFLDQYKYPNRTENADVGAALAHCRAFLAKLDEHLVEHGWLIPGRQTLADVAVFPFVRQFHFVDTARMKDWGFGAALAWLEAFLQTERFARVMTKRPLWTATQFARDPGC